MDVVVERRYHGMEINMSESAGDEPIARTFAPKAAHTPRSQRGRSGVQFPAAGRGSRR